MNHIRNTKAFKKGSNIATHAWLNDHSIDFDRAHVIDNGNFRDRKTLESWHTAITSEADNNAKQLPRQYSILFTTKDFLLSVFLFLFFTLFAKTMGLFNRLYCCCGYVLVYVVASELRARSPMGRKIW